MGQGNHSEDSSSRREREMHSRRPAGPHDARQKDGNVQFAGQICRCAAILCS
jgi:hypothetical protein